MLKNYFHTPVLLNEAIKSLNIKKDGIYIDGTFGRGGHSSLILSQLNEKGHLIAIDRDPLAIKFAKSINDKRFTIIHGSFSCMRDYIGKKGLLGNINGILLDLGISSPQIEDPTRGFSFLKDGPLDMRMDITKGLSAAEWLQKVSKKKLIWVLKTFGEERFAKRIAYAIFAKRKYKKINRTSELSELIIQSIPIYQKKHPARRSFQAIRMYINNELEEIEKTINIAPYLLTPGGRLSVISFHSIEDRLVKKCISKHTYKYKILKNIPLTELEIAKRYKNNLNLIELGKIKPIKQEINNNPRARSAILRIAEKIKL